MDFSDFSLGSFLTASFLEEDLEELLATDIDFTTRVMVKSIKIGKSSPKSSSKKEETVKKETKPKSEKSTN